MCLLVCWICVFLLFCGYIYGVDATEEERLLHFDILFNDASNAVDDVALIDWQGLHSLSYSSMSQFELNKVSKPPMHSYSTYSLCFSDQVIDIESSHSHIRSRNQPSRSIKSAFQTSQSLFSSRVITILSKSYPSAVFYHSKSFSESRILSPKLSDESVLQSSSSSHLISARSYTFGGSGMNIDSKTSITLPRSLLSSTSIMQITSAAISPSLSVKSSTSVEYMQSGSGIGDSTSSVFLSRSMFISESIVRSSFIASSASQSGRSFSMLERDSRNSYLSPSKFSAESPSKFSTDSCHAVLQIISLSVSQSRPLLSLLEGLSSSQSSLKLSASHFRSISNALSKRRFSGEFSSLQLSTSSNSLNLLDSGVSSIRSSGARIVSLSYFKLSSESILLPSSGIMLHSREYSKSIDQSIRPSNPASAYRSRLSSNSYELLLSSMQSRGSSMSVMNGRSELSGESGGQLSSSSPGISGSGTHSVEFVGSRGSSSVANFRSLYSIQSHGEISLPDSLALSHPSRQSILSAFRFGSVIRSSFFESILQSLITSDILPESQRRSVEISFLLSGKESSFMYGSALSHITSRLHLSSIRGTLTTPVVLTGSISMRKSFSVLSHFYSHSSSNVILKSRQRLSSSLSSFSAERNSRALGSVQSLIDFSAVGFDSRSMFGSAISHMPTCGTPLSFSSPTSAKTCRHSILFPPSILSSMDCLSLPRSSSSISSSIFGSLPSSNEISLLSRIMPSLSLLMSFSLESGDGGVVVSRIMSQLSFRSALTSSFLSSRVEQLCFASFLSRIDLCLQTLSPFLSMSDEKTCVGSLSRTSYQISSLSVLLPTSDIFRSSSPRFSRIKSNSFISLELSASRKSPSDSRTTELSPFQSVSFQSLSIFYSHEARSAAFTLSSIPSITAASMPSQFSSLRITMANPTAQPTTIIVGNPTNEPTIGQTEAPSAVPTVSPSIETTISPTASPSSLSPTAVPTMIPHSKTSLAPTLTPFVVPLSEPSVRPSIIPTANPTIVPTVEPTVDNIPAYTDSQLWAKYRSQLIRGQQVGNIVFGEYFYRGDSLGGSCLDWKSYVIDSVVLPLDNLFFSSIMLRSGFENVRNVSQTEEISYECNDVFEVGLLIEAVVSGQELRLTCNNQNWTVMTCSSSTVVCVNCNDVCSGIECPVQSSHSLLVSAFPCRKCDDRKYSWYTVLSLGYQAHILYPTINSIVGTTETTSITVRLNVSSSGIATCGSIPRNESLPSIATIQRTGASTLLTGSGLASLRISGLIPSTEYDLYCFTQDFKGHVMSLNSVLNTRMGIVTKCCRSISFVQLTNRLVEGVQSGINTFRLEGLPKTDSMVVIQVFPYVCTLNDVKLPKSVLSITPSAFRFTASSLSPSANFVLSGPAGCYEITARMISGDVFWNGTSNVFVRRATSPPSPPSLLSAQLTDDGRSILLTFDSITDRGSTVIAKYASSFPCSLIVTFSGSSSIPCYWASATILVLPISVNSIATDGIGANSSIMLMGGVVQANCPEGLACAYSPSSFVRILAPKNPVIPKVILSSPGTIGACDDILIDPTATEGQASRKWLNVRWSVDRGWNATAIEDYLNYVYPGGTDGLIRIPNSYLNISTYEITLTVVNFLGYSGAATLTVTKLNSGAVPKVTLSGPPNLLMYRWQPLAVLASVESQSCSGASEAVSFRWSVYQDYAFNSQILSNSLDIRYFKLPPYSLDISSSYVIRVVVSSASSSTSASVTVLLASTGVQAFIEGGVERTFGISNSVFLDASSSYDIDYPTSPLNFSWTCLQTFPLFGASCPNFVDSNVSILAIPANQLMSNVENLSGKFLFSVVAHNSRMVTGSYSTTVVVKMSSLPVVTILTSTTKKFNRGNDITLLGSITSISTCVAKWSANFDSLTSAVQTPVEKTFSKIGKFVYPIVISSNTLSSGQTYAFTLTASYGNISNLQMTSSSIVNVVINSPPTGGILSVSPRKGTALSTSFLISTFLWSDDSDDLPLSYILSYYSIAAGFSIVVKNVDTTGFVRTVLGQGVSALDYNITCVASARDIYGESSSVTDVVRVIPLTNETSLRQLASAAMETALLNGNPSAVSQIIGAVAGSLNAVNCTVPIKCSTIFRHECSTTTRTCGACFEGYIGINGDSNDPCIDPTPLPTNRLVSLAGVVSCEDDIDCPLGRCWNQTCKYLQKSCANNCSGHGFCDFFSVTNQVQSGCETTDPFCRPECRCIEGYSGKYCHIQDEYMATRQNIVEKMCSGLVATLPIQDVTGDVISSRMSSISNLLLDYSQLSWPALRDCTYVLTATIEADPAIAAQSSSAQSCLNAFSVVLSAGPRLPIVISKNISNALMILSAAIQMSLTFGQRFSDITTNSFRMSNGIVDAVDLHSVSLIVPQSNIESYLGLPSSSFQFNGSNFPVGGVGIRLLQYTISPNIEVTDAVSTAVSINGTSILGIQNLSLNMILQNMRPVNYSSIASTNATVLCRRSKSGQPYNVSVQCEGNRIFPLLCSGIENKVMFYSCPETHTQPQCTTWNGTQFDDNRLCTLSNFSATQTQCSCLWQSQNISSGRRKLTSSANKHVSEQQFGSTMVIVGENFVTTFESITQLSSNKLKDNLVITLTMAALLFLLVVVTYYAARQDLEAIKISRGYSATNSINSLRYKRNSSVYSSMKSLEGTTLGINRALSPIRNILDDLNPVDLLDLSWIEKLWNKIRISHYVFHVVSPFSTEGDFKSTSWLCGFVYITTVLFVNTLLCVLFSVDDGSCAQHATQDNCLQQVSLNQMDKLCSWSIQDHICTFNDNIGTNSVSAIAQSAMIALFSVPISLIGCFMVAKVREFVCVRWVDSWYPRMDLASLQSINQFDVSPDSKLMFMYRASRIFLMRKHIDEVDATRETASFVYAWTSRPHSDRSKTKVPRLLRKTLSHDINAEINLSEIHGRILRSRRIASEICKKMQRCNSDKEKERILLENFCIFSLRGFRRRIALKFLFGSNHIQDNAFAANLSAAHYISFVVLPLYLVGAILFVFLFGIKLGSRVINGWLVTTFLVIIQDMLLLRPLKITLMWALCARCAGSDTRIVQRHLEERSQLILNRRRGLLTNYMSPIQLFNPACRAARQFPCLRLSRILYSLNDDDIPASVLCEESFFMIPSVLSYIRSHPFVIVEFVCVWVVSAFALAPHDIQLLIIETSTLGLYYAVLLPIIWVLKRHWLYFVFALVGLFIALLVWWTYYRRRSSKPLRSSTIKTKSDIDAVVHEQALARYRIKPEPIISVSKVGSVLPVIATMEKVASIEEQLEEGTKLQLAIDKDYEPVNETAINAGIDVVNTTIDHDIRSPSDQMLLEEGRLRPIVTNSRPVVDTVVQIVASATATAATTAALSLARVSIMNHTPVPLTSLLSSTPVNPEPYGRASISIPEISISIADSIASSSINDTASFGSEIAVPHESYLRTEDIPIHDIPVPEIKIAHHCGHESVANYDSQSESVTRLERIGDNDNIGIEYTTQATEMVNMSLLETEMVDLERPNQSLQGAPFLNDYFVSNFEISSLSTTDEKDYRSMVDQIIHSSVKIAIEHVVAHASATLKQQNITVSDEHQFTLHRPVIMDHREVAEEMALDVILDIPQICDIEILTSPHHKKIEGDQAITPPYESTEENWKDVEYHTDSRPKISDAEINDAHEANSEDIAMVLDERIDAVPAISTAFEPAVEENCKFVVENHSDSISRFSLADMSGVDEADTEDIAMLIDDDWMEEGQILAVVAMENISDNDVKVEANSKFVAAEEVGAKAQQTQSKGIGAGEESAPISPPKPLPVATIQDVSTFGTKRALVPSAALHLITNLPDERISGVRKSARRDLLRQLRDASVEKKKKKERSQKHSSAAVQAEAVLHTATTGLSSYQFPISSKTKIEVMDELEDLEMPHRRPAVPSFSTIASTTTGKHIIDSSKAPSRVGVQSQYEFPAEFDPVYKLVQKQLKDQMGSTHQYKEKESPVKRDLRASVLPTSGENPSSSQISWARQGQDNMLTSHLQPDRAQISSSWASSAAPPPSQSQESPPSSLIQHLNKRIPSSVDASIAAERSSLHRSIPTYVFPTSNNSSSSAAGKSSALDKYGISSIETSSGQRSALETVAKLQPKAPSK